MLRHFVFIKYRQGTSECAYRRVPPENARLNREYSHAVRSRGRPRRATRCAQLGRRAQESAEQVLPLVELHVSLVTRFCEGVV